MSPWLRGMRSHIGEIRLLLGRAPAPAFEWNRSDLFLLLLLLRHFPAVPRKCARAHGRKHLDSRAPYSRGWDSDPGTRIFEQTPYSSTDARYPTHRKISCLSLRPPVPSLFFPLRSLFSSLHPPYLIEPANTRFQPVHIHFAHIEHYFSSEYFSSYIII